MTKTRRCPNRNLAFAAPAWARVAPAFLLALVLALAPAHAALAITLDAPFSVADDATRVEVAKLDKASHEFVEGAKLAVSEKSTGAVVDSWESGAGIHELVGVLEAGAVYVLEETDAPDGYAKAGKVEFQIPQDEVGVELLSGPDAEKSGDYRIDLYDTAVNTQVVHRSASSSAPAPAAAGTPRTGDGTSAGLVAGLAVAAVAAIAVLLFAQSRLRRGR